MYISHASQLNTNQKRSNDMSQSNTLLAPVGWMKQVAFTRCGNGYEVHVLTNDDRQFKVGFLRKVVVVDDQKQEIIYYHYTPSYLNCEPSMRVNKWILEQVEENCDEHCLKLW